MTAIPKALAMANPTNFAACVATVTGVISSKFAIDAVANTLTEVELDNRLIEGLKCEEAYVFCNKSPEECTEEYNACKQAL